MTLTLQLIVHDVEAITRQRLVYSSEIIEIAAIRILIEDKYTVKDTFHAYVQPQSVASIPIATTRLTGISEEEMKQAASFVRVVAEFQEWLGQEEYFLCSWSLSDRDFFVDDCIAHRTSTDWILNYNDVQQWYVDRFGLKRRVGLSKALESMQLQPEGQFHSALADTQCTWMVLQALYPDPVDLPLLRNNCTGVPATEIVYRDEETVLDEDNPFFKLRQLR